MAETSSSSMTFIPKHLKTAILNFKCFCGMGRQHPSYSVVEYIILPNLTLDVPYSLRCNPYTKEVSAVSDEWLISLANLSPTQEREFRGLHAGLLCGSSYVDCEAEQLRAVTDFTSFLFCLDDWSDKFDIAGTKGLAECVLNTLYHPDTYFADAVVWRVTNDFWTRMLETIGPRCADRFIERMDMYFQAVMQQASDRELGTVPDLDTYIPLRRDTSGCKAGFTLIEYSLNIELLDDIAEHPVIRDLEDAANDAISWQNDILSYNVEQAKGDTHNLVVVLMNQLKLSRQDAIDRATDLTRDTIARFETSRVQLPSWGAGLDDSVRKYVQGLQDWVVSNCHWSFDTERYFGGAGADVKETLRIPLLPRRPTR